jgi:hypothetical protein
MPVHLEPLSSEIGTDNLLRLHPKTIHGWQAEANRLPGRQVFTNCRQTNLTAGSANPKSPGTAPVWVANWRRVVVIASRRVYVVLRRGSLYGVKFEVIS